MDDRTKKITVRFGLLADLTLACLCLVIFRIVAAGRTGYIFLIWNLFLAWLPLFFAMAAEHFHHKGKQSVFFWVFCFLWLIFFPNAPYIVTDITHLQPHINMPLWYDAVMVLSFAATGVLLGLCSLNVMGRVMVQKLAPFWSWLFAVAVSLLAGFGIYIGRYLRWNSWDVLLNPRQLIQDIGDRLSAPLFYPQTWFISLLFAALVISSYVVFNHFFDYRHTKN